MNVPDIVLGSILLNGVSTSAIIDNRPSSQNTGIPCALWSLDWSAQPGVTSLTIEIQAAPDNNGAPGVFASIASGTAFPSGKVNYYTATGYFPWLRVAVTVVGGAGNISCQLSGWRDDASSISASGGGGGGGTSSAFGAPFPADGTAAGALGTNGDMEPLSLDSSGNLLVDIAAGAIVVTPVTSDTVSAAGPTTVGTTSATLLAANANRKKLILQNVGTTKIWVLFGTGSASSSNYHIALPAGGTSNDGSSPPYVDTMWTGAIQAISSAAGGEVQAMEFT